MESKDVYPCLILFSMILHQTVHGAIQDVPGQSLGGSKVGEQHISKVQHLSKVKTLSSEGLPSKKQMYSREQLGSGKQLHFGEEPYSRERPLFRELTASTFQAQDMNSRGHIDTEGQPMSGENAPSVYQKNPVGEPPSVLQYSPWEPLHQEGNDIEQLISPQHLQYSQRLQSRKHMRSRSRRDIQPGVPSGQLPNEELPGEQVLTVENDESREPLPSGQQQLRETRPIGQQQLRETLLLAILKRLEQAHGELLSEDGLISLGNDNQSGDIWGGNGDDNNDDDDDDDDDDESDYINDDKFNHSQNGDYYRGDDDSYVGQSNDYMSSDNVKGSGMKSNDDNEEAIADETSSYEYSYEDFINGNLREDGHSKTEEPLSDVNLSEYKRRSHSESGGEGSSSHSHAHTELLTGASPYSGHNANTDNDDDGDDGNDDDAAWQAGHWPGAPPSELELLISAHSLGLPASAEALSCLEGECDGEAGTSGHPQRPPLPPLPPATPDTDDDAFISPADSTDVLTSNYGRLQAGIPPPHRADMFQSGKHQQNQPLAEAEGTTSTDSAPVDVTPETAVILTKEEEKRRGGRPKSNYGNAEALQGKVRGWEGTGMDRLSTGDYQKPSVAAGRPHRPLSASLGVTSGKTSVRPNELPSNHVSSASNSGKDGRQRFIFGSDDRGRVSVSDSRKYPYNNVVRMSNGCTGTLVSPKHVLTAAHCLHTGYKFKAAPYRLKVRIPHSMGTRVYYARAVKVSRKWHKVYQLSNLHRAMFDYGVLELRHPVLDRRRFTGFDWSSDTWRHPISFVAYPADTARGQPYLLRSTCHVDLQAGSLLLNRCDSARGTSGSAAIMPVKKRGLRIVGVVSAVVSDVLALSRDFNVITRLTLPKLWDICDMLGRGWDRYVCSDYLLRKRPTRYSHKYLYQNG